MLPSRPSPRAVGGTPLPSSRSRAVRPDREEPGRHNTSDYNSRNAYPRQSPSFSSPTSARERSRSRPRASDAVREGNSHRTYDRPDQPKQRVSGASSSSVSSASSFLDRMRTGQGVSSSRTSLEEEDEVAKRVRRPPGGSYRQQRIKPGEDRDSGGPVPSASPREDGYSLWNTVAAAASTLTVSVSKAWQANVNDPQGSEEASSNQDSHLIRAMRAYHLEKAKDPSDLPDWLFSEQERFPVRSRFANRREEVDEGYESSLRSPPVSASVRSPGLRDIYATAAATASPTSPSTRNNTRGYSEEGINSPSKATDRLKALRDAKRNALNPNRLATEERVADNDNFYGNERGSADQVEVSRAPPPRRVGLPSRPQKR